MRDCTMNTAKREWRVWTLGLLFHFGFWWRNLAVTILCGLLLHIDAENNYATTSLFLTDTRKAVNHSNDFHSFLFCITYRIHFCLICSGKIHIQVHGDTGHTSAFLSPFKVPLHQWCRHSLEILGRVVKSSIACMEGQQKFVSTAEHIFGKNVMLDDTHGYFVIGGGKFIRGIGGYYGPATYYHIQGLPADQVGYG
ncbi:protein sel-1 homolog 3-like, partial [Cyprinus carpio]|uniref:Protein sel-1 homolog 3-like n=1 Tax=Cyprinus carpio TaxID=7962 RepID=A0A9R0BA76_CYPCA